MTLNPKRKLEEMTLDDFHGFPRASSFIPRHSDIKKIADYMKLAMKPQVLDAGCGNGFITMLLTAEGIANILGVNMELNDYSRYLRERGKLHLEEGDVRDGKWYKQRNIIFNSWMPAHEDWSGCFKYIKPTPNLIIYVKSRSTGVQPGMSNNYNNCDTYKLQAPFIEADRWACVGNDDFVDEKTPEIKFQTGEIIIQTLKDFYDSRAKRFRAIAESPTVAEPYNWERELPKQSKF